MSRSRSGSRRRRPIRRIALSLALGVVAIAMAAAPGTIQQDDSGLETLIGRAAEYAARFEDALSRAIADEQMTQRVTARDRRVTRRRIDSEVYLAPLDDGAVWFTARDVLRVDGRRVGDGGNIARLFQRASGDLTSQLRALANEGARYNIGPVRHNFTDPALPIFLLDRRQQARFRFTATATGDDATTLVHLREIARPTLITGAGGRSLPLTATVTLRPDGVLIDAELVIDAAPSAQVQVHYAENRSLGVFVPDVMQERYVATRGDVIESQSVYVNYRRFETAGRLVTPATP